MENITNVATTIAGPGSSTSINFRTQGSASAFAMSTRGCTLAARRAGLIAGQRWIDATDLVIDPSATIRERKVTAKGHLGFVAYVPGIHAWSPPLC